MGITHGSLVLSMVPRSFSRHDGHSSDQADVSNAVSIAGWEGKALVLLTLALLAFGLVNVYSASLFMTERLGAPSHHFVVNQAIGAVAGIVMMVVGARLPYQFWRRMAWPLLGLTLLLLLLLILPWTESVAPVRNGARRWLSIRGITLQPSEFAKFALIVWTAWLVTKKQSLLGDFRRGLLPMLIVWMAVALLILLEPNASSALILLAISMLMAFVGGARIRHFIALALVGFPLLWNRIDAAQYRAARLATFLNPAQETTGAGYQVNQALISFGSGGVTGRGFGAGQQKYGFLPEPHNDFILAMIGEEWGFVGVVALSLLFLALVALGVRIARRSPDLFGFLLAIGLTGLIGLQVILHFGVNVALLPATGVALPFISYGRSGLLVSLFAIGVLVNVANAGRGPR